MNKLKNFIKRPKVVMALVLVAFSLFMNVIVGVAPPAGTPGGGP